MTGPPENKHPRAGILRPVQAPHLPEKVADGLLARGVPPELLDADLQHGVVEFLGDGRFDIACRGNPRPVPALLHQVRDAGEIIDLVASPGSRLASWRAAAFGLGQDQVWIPPFADPLHVHVYVLDWLRAGRRGICTVLPGMVWAMLHHRRLLTTGTEEFAATLRDPLAPPLSHRSRSSLRKRRRSQHE